MNRTGAESNVLKAIKNAREREESDPLRPSFHFCPPAQWMNDPNGPICVDGTYHLFYQHNPFSDSWDHMHWGHAQTADFVNWEHMPVALYPDGDAREAHCFSGCCVIGPDNAPVAIYTSVARDRDERPNRQRAAVGDRRLLNWRKIDKPVLSIGDAPPGTRGDWRDPYVFVSGRQKFMVIGSIMPHQGQNRAVVLLFEAGNGYPFEWHYRGPLHIGEPEMKFPECPNYFRLGDRWILLISPFGPVQYYAGDKGASATDFTSQHRGVVDHSAEYYATNTIHDGRRLILLAWIRGFPEGRGWNGCLALPRALGLDTDGSLLQQPIEETRALRVSETTIEKAKLRGDRILIQDLPVRNMELELVVSLPPGSHATLGLADQTESVFSLDFDQATGVLRVGGLAVPLSSGAARAELSLRLFVDRSVVELFVNGGRQCVTRVSEKLLSANRVAIEMSGGASIKSLRCWEMSPLRYTDHE